MSLKASDGKHTNLKFPQSSRSQIILEFVVQISIAAYKKLRDRPKNTGKVMGS
jgi:hypothetical protein